MIHYEEALHQVYGALPFTFIHILKEGAQSMNRDEDSYQLSHAYDRFLGTRDGTGSVILTRDPTRPGTLVTRDPD